MGATAEYPSQIGTYTTKENKVDIYDADHVNRLQNEVNATQTELGVGVKGNLTDLVERLGMIQNSNGGFAQGTDFPTNPVIGQAFFDTDVDTLYIYTTAGWTSQASFRSSTLFQLNACCGGSAYHVRDGVLDGTNPKYEYRGMSIGASAWNSYYNNKWEKIAGVTKITAYAQLWGGTNVHFRFAVGTLYSTQADRATGYSTAPEWVTSELNVDGLDNGTVYDVVLEVMQDGGGASNAYLGNVFAYGS